MSFRDFLKNKRRELGLTQEDLARNANISHSYVQKLERKGVRLNVATEYIEQLAKALRVNPEEIFRELAKTASPSIKEAIRERWEPVLGPNFVELVYDQNVLDILNNLYVLDHEQRQHACQIFKTIINGIKK